MSTPFWAAVAKPVLAWLGVLAALGIVGAVTVIYTGVFNVAATVQDAPALRWLLVTTREASVQRRARGIKAPDLSATQQVERGFIVYRHLCAMCHAAPGREAAPMADGLNPQPPTLVDAAEEMRAAELYWVIRNGIRFTGMPAWTGVLDEREIWDVVAFLRRLPEMKPTDFDTLDRRFPPQPGT